MRLLLVMNLFLAGGVALPAPVPRDKDKLKDEVAIVGIWKVENLQNEVSIPDDVVAAIRFRFQKDGVLVMRDAVVGENLKYKIDATASPKTIDLITQGGNMLGIYELEGDTLKICTREDPKRVRPTKFQVTGPEITVFTLKRVKDEPKK